MPLNMYNIVKSLLLIYTSKEWTGLPE